MEGDGGEEAIAYELNLKLAYNISSENGNRRLCIE
jgi:hypothetical protein